MGSENESYIFSSLGEVLWDPGKAATLTGLELTLSTAAPTVLCFGSVVRTVLLTQGCFMYKCWAAFTQLQGLFCLSGCPTSQGAPTGSWKGTKYRENSKQEAPLNVFSVSSRMEKVLLHATGCLLYSSCSASQSPHYISESQAMCNIAPETLSESKNIPCTVCCTELWPKSRYSLEHYGLSNKIMRFFFPWRAL